MGEVGWGSEEGDEFEFKGESRWCCGSHLQGWREEEGRGGRSRLVRVEL